MYPVSVFRGVEWKDFVVFVDENIDADCWIYVSNLGVSMNFRGNLSSVVLSSCMKGSYFAVLTALSPTLCIFARMYQRKQYSSLRFFILRTPFLYRDLGVSMKDSAPKSDETSRDLSRDSVPSRIATRFLQIEN